MAGLLDTIKEKAKQVYSQGLLNQVITNPASVGQEISQIFDPNYMRNIKPMTQEGALDVALSSPTMALTFIGKGSNLWNPKNEQLFAQLEKKGLSPEEIWKKTGTLRGVDGKLRQEISDVGSAVTDNVYEGIIKNKRFEDKLNKALTHPELYKSYPDIKNIKTGMYAWQTPEGSYDELSRTITAGGPGTTSQKSALLHEIQHDIQRKEGFATGGTPTSTVGAGLNKENQFDWAKRAYEDSIGKSGQMSDDQLLAELLDKPFTQKNYKNWDQLTQREKLNWLDAGRQMAYRRLAGEAEARMTQSRMKLTPEERLQYFPYNQGKFGLDVPYEELIVKGLL